MCTQAKLFHTEEYITFKLCKYVSNNDENYIYDKMW